MDNKMFILQGNKTWEHLMIYLKNCDDKIYNNASLTPLEKLAFLKRIINKEAQTIVSNVEANFEDYSKVEDIDTIHYHCIRAEIRSKYDSDDKIVTYFAATRTAPYKKSRIEYIIQESIYHLKVKIFDSERLGISSFIQLKKTVN